MHTHAFEDKVSLDGSGYEKVCTECGTVAPSEIDIIDKVSGCMDLNEFMNVKYGPPTPVALESFLLPTLRRIKCRDQFVDAKILAKLRIYTAMLRICEQNNIPKMYADEAMRRLLKSGKGVHSKYALVRHLIDSIMDEPRLLNRLPALKELLERKKS